MARVKAETGVCVRAFACLSKLSAGLTPSARRKLSLAALLAGATAALQPPAAAISARGGVTAQHARRQPSGERS